MPTFETIPLQEARLSTATGRQGQIIKQYADYLQQLDQGRAGRLLVVEDEKISTIRRRLTTTAKVMDKDLVVKRMGAELYFWEAAPEDGRPRRRRKSRTASETEGA